MSTLSRLSDQNIEDTIMRGFLYDEIVSGDFDNAIEYELKPDELPRADLVSYRVYGTPDLDWLILVAAGISDPIDNMRYGETLKLPPAQWVRSRIRYWQESGELSAAEVSDEKS